MVDGNKELIKTEFDFGWKEWHEPPCYAVLALKHQKGDVLDVGCATCKIYEFLRKNNWKGKYYGIDMEKYDNYEYPDDVNLIIGNALELEFPKVDTVLLYNILEHVDEPVRLLKKVIAVARKNVLINVPKRNEEIWRYGVVEYHQLDKTHKHCGFSKEEVYRVVDLAGGRITRWEEWDEVTVIPLNVLRKRLGILLLSSMIGKRILPKRTFCSEIWLEMVKK